MAAMGALAIPFFLAWLGCLICGIIVVVKLFQEEGAGKGILGLICGLYTLIWGWQNAKRLNISTLMLIWTVLLVILIVIRVAAIALSQ